MSQSLFAGVSGLRAHQEMLDVVGNNLANLNTTGFKEQRARFSDLVYENLANATDSTTGTSGTDPVQIGFGVQVAAIDSNFQQGGLEATGGDLDLAIQGSGFFVVNDGTQDVYTRDGAFGVDANGYLVNPATGMRVQRFGNVGEGSPTAPAFQATGDTGIRIPSNAAVPARATTTVSLQGNLSTSATGPLATTLTSAAPFTKGGSPADSSTLLDDLDGNSADYAAGDTIVIQGTAPDGSAVNTTLAAGPTTTLGDLVAAVTGAFPGATASLDASGNLLLKANTTGPSTLALTLSDAATNTGHTNFSGHGMVQTTAGKVGDTVHSVIQVFDSQGTAHNLSLTFQKQGSDIWDLTATIPSADGTMIDGSVTGITFNDDGSFQQVMGTGAGGPELSFQVTGMAAPQTVTLAMGSPGGFNGLTQFGGPTSAEATSQDGYAAGFLTRLSIGDTGVISGVFTNGQTLSIAQLAIASFQNPGGLNREGNNNFSLTTQSGPALVGDGLSGGRGSVKQGALESSNVDVALEFTRLITAQRGFQVNARTITVSDQVLQDLANIIR